MVHSSAVEKLFSVFTETTRTLEKELSCTYLDALAETGENLFQGKVIQEEVSEVTAKRLEQIYEHVQLDQYSNEDIRKAFQLALLKGMKEEYIQPNHQMTPDGVGMLISYLVQKFMDGQTEYSILDPAVGTGNLLMTVLNGHTNGRLHATGIDIDESLLRLAYVSANLQGHPIQFFNQDSLDPLYVDPVDVVIADLPVGYYPNDVRANDYELKTESGHAFAHHLFIEQSCKYVKPGGYLFFIVPNHLFNTDQSVRLHEYINKTMKIQGVLQLPLSMFANDKAGKSIFILQKNKPGLTPPKQVLLVNLPKLTNIDAVEIILQKINAWMVENKTQDITKS